MMNFSKEAVIVIIIERENDSGKKKEVKHFVPRPNYLFLKL